MVKQYLDHCLEILTSPNTYYKPNRTDSGTLSMFGYQARYDLSKGFPISTTKKVPFKTVTKELLWFRDGNTSVTPLSREKVKIWEQDGYSYFQKKFPEKTETFNEWKEKILNDDEFASQYGGLGPIYGAQWRNWTGRDGRGIDQLSNAIDTIKNNPNSRRIIVSAWNPTDIPNMALPPCHTFFQFNPRDDKLDLQMYQRSADMFLGVPFNITSYSLLLEMVAKETGYTPGDFVHTFGDSHIYTGTGDRDAWYRNKDNLMALKSRVAAVGLDNLEGYLDVANWIEESAPVDKEKKDHVPAILEQLSRTPYDLPTIDIADKPFYELKIDDIELVGYKSHGKIQRAMAGNL